MGKDRSLANFLGSDDADEPDDVTSEPSDSETEPPSTRGAVAPATPTYRWSPDGATCADCGDTVERRWRDDGQFVCADCKDW